MANDYQARHRAPGRHRATAGSARHCVPAKVLRRPLLTTGALVALVGASAAGYARAGDVTSSAQVLSVTAAALTQANAANNAQLEEDANLRSSVASTAMQASAAADRRNTA
ncbi:MAG: hypothetical protein M3Y71_04990, partial [Actinomycetota bacterium]|nr:hypothetical protein [Actinomycetota bacterium]